MNFRIDYSPLPKSKSKIIYIRFGQIMYYRSILAYDIHHEFPDLDFWGVEDKIQYPVSFITSLIEAEFYQKSTRRNHDDHYVFKVLNAVEKPSINGRFIVAVINEQLESMQLKSIRHEL